MLSSMEFVVTDLREAEIGFDFGAFVEQEFAKLFSRHEPG